MPVVTYILTDGTRQEVVVAAGRSVMQGALDAGLDGIVAECGGNAMCATCHVYAIEPGAGLPPVAAHEDALLEGTAAERRPNSRLACQLPAVDGLVVAMPECQV